MHYFPTTQTLGYGVVPTTCCWLSGWTTIHNLVYIYRWPNTYTLGYIACTDNTYSWLCTGHRTSSSICTRNWQHTLQRNYDLVYDPARDKILLFLEKKYSEVPYKNVQNTYACTKTKHEKELSMIIDRACTDNIVLMNTKETPSLVNTLFKEFPFITWNTHVSSIPRVLTSKKMYWNTNSHYLQLVFRAGTVLRRTRSDPRGGSRGRESWRSTSDFRPWCEYGFDICLQWADYSGLWCVSLLSC